VHISLLDLKAMYATIRDGIASDMVHPKTLHPHNCSENSAINQGTCPLPKGSAARFCRWRSILNCLQNKSNILPHPC